MAIRYVLLTIVKYEHKIRPEQKTFRADFLYI